MVILSQAGVKGQVGGGGPGPTSSALLQHGATSPPQSHATYHAPSFGDEDFAVPQAITNNAQPARVNAPNHHPPHFHPTVLAPGQPRPAPGYQFQSYPHAHNFLLYPHNGIQSQPTRPLVPGIPFPDGYQLTPAAPHDQPSFLPVEPHFPPQNFEIPDIQVSNSVMSGGPGTWDGDHMSTTESPPGGVKSAGSPPGSSHGGSPGGGRESAIEDCSSSDDSLPLALLAQKRPADHATVTPIKTIPTPAPAKKPKAPKKRKKRDPNEPQKPVSAYALFFRDTQAAIKSRNPSASFGEVSKIVASMWDGLEEDHKNVYKKRTETAKKEYLKQLAAYRASLVSQGGVVDGVSESNSDRSRNNNNNTRQTMMPDTMATSQPVAMLNTMTTLGSSPSSCGSSPLTHTIVSSATMNHMPPPPPHQLRTGPPSADGIPVHQAMCVGGQSAVMHGMTAANVMTNHQPPMSAMTNNRILNSQMLASSPPHGMGSPGPGRCIRHGCNNAAVDSPAWDYEYCSNECVVSHCRDVFTTWVATGQQSPPGFASVK